jgi:undecaprenyl pyrophosphate phosphatase UppP
VSPDPPPGPHHGRGPVGDARAPGASVTFSVLLALVALFPWLAAACLIALAPQTLAQNPLPVALGLLVGGAAMAFLSLLQSAITERARLQGMENEDLIRILTARMTTGTDHPPKNTE